MTRYQRAEVWGSWFLLLFLLGVVTAAYAQQTYDERRIQELVDIHAAERLARLETRIDTVNSIGEGILIIVAGQLALSIMGVRKRSGG